MEPDSKIYENRILILLNIVAMPFMATLDSSIVNVALPKMAEYLSVTTESIAWIVTVYLVVISATILIFGRLGDILGMTKVFQYGILLFTIGSLLCGASSSLAMLIVARTIQAIGGAAAMSTSHGIITQVFPASERGKALGINGTFVALGTMVGPPLGGFIVDILSWHYIFLINVPVGIFVFFMGRKILPHTNKASKEKMDIKGAVLFALIVVSLFSSITMGEHTGYAHPLIIAGFVISLVTLILFIFMEKKVSMPLLELRIFENKLFSLSIFCGFISFVSIGCTLIIQPFYLQSAMKFSPSFTGLVMMTYPLVLSVVAPLSGHLSDRIGSEFLTFIGLLLTSVGLFLMSTLNTGSSLVCIVSCFAIMSIGNGMFQSPNTSLIMSNVPRSKLGIAGSVNALVRNLGLVLGISLSVTLLYHKMSSKLGYQVFDYVQGRDDVFIYGMHGVFFAAAVICIIGAILTAYRLYGKKSKPANIISDESMITS